MEYVIVDGSSAISQGKYVLFTLNEIPCGTSKVDFFVTVFVYSGATELFLTRKLQNGCCYSRIPDMRCFYFPRETCMIKK